jgi:hypothetical protein
LLEALSGKLAEWKAEVETLNGHRDSLEVKHVSRFFDKIENQMKEVAASTQRHRFDFEQFRYKTYQSRLEEAKWRFLADVIRIATGTTAETAEMTAETNSSDS